MKSKHLRDLHGKPFLDVLHVLRILHLGGVRRFEAWRKDQANQQFGCHVDLRATLDPRIVINTCSVQLAHPMTRVVCCVCAPPFHTQRVNSQQLSLVWPSLVSHVPAVWMAGPSQFMEETPTCYQKTRTKEARIVATACACFVSSSSSARVRVAATTTARAPGAGRVLQARVFVCFVNRVRLRVYACYHVHLSMVSTCSFGVSFPLLPVSLSRSPCLSLFISVSVSVFVHHAISLHTAQATEQRQCYQLHLRGWSRRSVR